MHQWLSGFLVGRGAQGAQWLFMKFFGPRIPEPKKCNTGTVVTGGNRYEGKRGNSSGDTCDLGGEKKGPYPRSSCILCVYKHFM